MGPLDPVYADPDVNYTAIVNGVEIPSAAYSEVMRRELETGDLVYPDGWLLSPVTIDMSCVVFPFGVDYTSGAPYQMVDGEVWGLYNGVVTDLTALINKVPALLDDMIEMQNEGDSYYPQYLDGTNIRPLVALRSRADTAVPFVIET